MAKAVIMPKFGFTQDESTLVAWLKHEGDAVEKGEPIAECTTDKVNMEIEAPEDGVLGGIRYEAGATVPVTEVIAYVLQEGEPVPEEAAAAPATPATGEAAEPATTAGEPTVTPLARRIAEAEGIDLAAVAGSGAGGKITREDVERYAAAAQQAAAEDGKVRATPAARRVAREERLDLASIEGSGPRGRVQEADALAAAQARTATAAAPGRAAAPYPAPVGEPQVIPLEGMRRTIAERMQQSYQQAPHVTFTLDADMTQAIALREYANERLPAGEPRLSMTAVIVKAAAWALRQHPLVNSYLHNGEIYVMPEVNVGMAVALDEGLIVPVIRRADQKGLRQIGREVVDLSQRARSGELRPEEVVDGTFTVSNLGMFGIDRFTAILNPPQVGILAVGRIARRFVPDENDQPVVKPLMTLTLVTDHRVIDGAQSAQFLATLAEALQEPASILL